MDQIVRIEQELDGFKDTLSLYRQQLGGFLSRNADKVSRATDMPSLMDMERLIKLGNTTTAVSSGDDDFLSGVAQCPEGGILEIESKFESVYDIPLGNIQVDVIAIDGGKSTPVKLDENGKGQFTGTPGKFYRVHVQSEVTPDQINDLFSSYDGLTEELEGWLRKEWEGFKPQWSQQSASASLAAVGNGMLAGSWDAIQAVWDGIGELTDILKDPNAFAEKLGESAGELAKSGSKRSRHDGKSHAAGQRRSGAVSADAHRSAVARSIATFATGRVFGRSYFQSRGWFGHRLVNWLGVERGRGWHCLADSAPGQVQRADFSGSNGLHEVDGHDHQ